MDQSSESAGDITALLAAWSGGEAGALDRLAELVGPDLRRLAIRHMRGELAGHTLQTTALVNEVYLKLLSAKGFTPESRLQFFAAAAQIMRHILVDYARRRRRAKRGGDVLMVSLAEAQLRAHESTVDVMALHEALEELAAFDAAKSRIVELRFFGGLSEQETADALKLPLRSLQREWSLARAWLFTQLKPLPPARAGGRP